MKPTVRELIRKYFLMRERTMLTRHVRYGEDVNFCRKWRELGGKIYTTFWPQATHIGHYIYR